MSSRRVAFLSLLLPVLVFAAGPDPLEAPFAARPWDLRAAAKSVPVPEGADYDVLFDDLLVRFDAEGRETRVLRVVYRVNTPRGVEVWGGVSAEWTPWHQNRPEIRARVVDVSGKEYVLDPATLTESAAEPEQSIYTDRKVLRAPLPGVAPGAIVEEQTTLSEHTPFFDAGSAGHLFVERGTKIHATRVRLEAPKSLPLTYELRAEAMKVKTSEKNGVRTIEFTRGPWERPESAVIEDFAPEEVLPWAHVEYATARSWAEIARRYHQRIEEKLGKAERKAISGKVVGNAKTRLEKSRKLLAWVQEQVRYTGLQLGEASIIPATPEETLDRGFGDCKDLSTLMVALLRAEGIPAHLALLRTQKGFITDKLPGMGLVDHAIVYVPPTKGEPAIWMDPTVPTLLAGQVPSWLEGRPVLVAAPGTKGLTTLPESTSKDNTALTVREWHLADFGPGRAIEERTATGALAEQYRSTARDGAKEVESLFSEFAEAYYRSAEIVGVRHTPNEKLDPTFHARFEIPRAPVTDTGWSDVTVMMPRSLPFSWMPPHLKQLGDSEEETAPKPRQSDLVLSFPHLAEMRFRIVPPRGFVLRGALPKDEQLKLGPAKYEARFEQAKDGVITASFRLDSVKRRYTAAEVETFRKDYAEFMDSAVSELVFESEGARLFDENQISEALEKFRAEVARTPNSAIAHARYAGALIDLGLGDAAREAAKRATVAQPEALIGWLTLGWVQARDLFGREYREGFDRKGAIFSHRKAILLAPDDAEIHLRVARLHERNDKGELYGEGADLPDAINAYTYVADILKVAEAEPPLLGALFAARRFDDLIRRAPKVAESPERNALWIAAIAARDGEQAALSEAARRLRDVGTRRQALTAASGHLSRLRRYQTAAALLREGLKGSGNAQQLGYLAMLEKMKPFEEVKLDPADPRAAIVALVRWALKGEGEPVPLFVRRVRTQLEKEGIDSVDGFTEDFREMSSEVRSVGLDAVASAMPLITDGDPKTGYRVSLRGVGPGTSPDLFLLVEDGTVKLLAAATEVGTLASEAFFRAQKGDLVGARKWMEWSRDLTQNSSHPLAAEFNRLWPRGHQGSKEEILRASALLVANSFDAPQVISTLQQMEQSAPPANKPPLWFALALAHGSKGDAASVLKWADKLLAVQPGSNEAFGIKLKALREKDDAKGMIAAAQARLAALPNDALATSVLVDRDLLKGDLHAAISRYRALVDAQTGTWITFNNLAWFSLALGNVDEQVQEWALRAVSMTQEQRASSLNTLAAVYARAGRGPEAMQFLLKSLDLDHSPDQLAANWFAAGLIAESYGLSEEALKLYARVEKPAKEDRADSVWQVTRARIAELDKQARPPVVKPGPP